jgi:hypothetical protein
MLAGGDSLLEGSGLHVDLQSPDGNSLYAARINPNAEHRLAQIRLTVAADSFAAAEACTPGHQIPPRPEG